MKLPRKMFTLTNPTDVCILVILGWIIGCTAITSPRAALISGLAVIFLLFRKEIWRIAKKIGMLSFAALLLPTLIFLLFLFETWLGLCRYKTTLVAGTKILVHIMFGSAVMATVIAALWFFIALYWVFSPEGTPPGAILETTRYYWRIVFFTPLLLLGFTPTIKKSFWQYL